METIDTFSPTCQTYFESNISAWAFCRQVGMKENRFHYTGRPKSARNRRKNSEILPVRINSQSWKVVLIGGQGTCAMRLAHPVCEIIFPSGVNVRLSGKVNGRLYSSRPVLFSFNDSRPNILLNGSNP